MVGDRLAIGLLMACAWQVITEDSSTAKRDTEKLLANQDPDTSASELEPEARGSPGIVILYSKHSQKDDFGKDPYDYPGNYGRILNKPPSFQNFDNHHHKHGGPKPGCAHDVNYCLFDKEYPVDKVHDIVNNYHDDVHHMYHGLNHYPPQDYIAYDNYTHGYRHKGHFVCESEVSYIRPGWAKNWKGEWVAVVNTDKYPQSVRIETCKFAGKKCEYLPPCYKSYCVQRYTFVKLLCVDPYNPHHRPIVDVFEIPSACSCFVENFVYY